MKTGFWGWCLLGGILLAGCETRFRVEGDSMLPTFLGGSVLETCPKCGYTSPGRPSGTFVCANCRWLVREKERGNLAEKEPVYDEVVLRKGKKPQRDDCVLVVSDEGTLAVKRVLGLPGETVEIREGKVWIDGKRPIRPLEKWEENRILVHDDRFRPGGISRWLATGKGDCLPEGWHVETRDFSAPAWLTYHHAEGSFLGGEKDVPNSTGESFVPAAMTNLRSENGPQMRDAWIHTVDELQLTFRLSAEISEGVVMVRLPLGETVHTFWLLSRPTVLARLPKESFPTGSWSVYEGNFPSEENSEERSDDWVFSTLDGVPRVWRNRQLLSEYPTESLEEYCANIHMPPWEEENRSVRVGFQGIGTVKWEQMTLFRGEYWLFYPPYFDKMPKLEGKTLAKEGENGYYLIGDNCLVSRDSRLWGTIPPEQIRGVAVKWEPLPNSCRRENFR
ncbi:MAG: S26 family signal peptidase [Planctomycetia bacterium]|nr:S26 family signal peptidase [Planctomycetia bacterium]